MSCNFCEFVKLFLFTPILCVYSHTYLRHIHCHPNATVPQWLAIARPYVGVLYLTTMNNIILIDNDYHMVIDNSDCNAPDEHPLTVLGPFTHWSEYVRINSQSDELPF